MSRAGAEIVSLTEDKYNQWNEYVHLHPFGTVFHTTYWLQRVSDKVQVYAQQDIQGNIIGGLALGESSRFKIKSFHLPPYTSYYGPLFGNEKVGIADYTVSRQQDFIEQLLKALPARGHYDMKVKPEQLSLHPFYWNGYQVELGLTYIIDDAEAFEQNINKEYKRIIGKLQQELENGDLSIEEVRDGKEIIALQSRLSDRKSFNPQLLALREITRDFDPTFMEATIIRSKHYGILSGAFGVYDQHSYYNLVNASARVDHPLYKNANLLLIYHLIKRSLNRGRVFDLEGSLLKGVEAFYRKLGGVQTPVYRLQKSYSWYFLMRRTVKFIKNNLQRA